MRNNKLLKVIVFIMSALALIFIYLIPPVSNGEGIVKDNRLLNNNVIAEATENDLKLSPAGTQSGSTSYVPWESDEKFLASQNNNTTPVLMAAYRTVLRDPLPGEEENVHLAARYLAGTVIKPGEVFSQNNKLGPYIQSRGYKEGPTYLGSQLTTTIGGGVCKMASTLYNVTIMSNLAVVERYCHSMPVPYVPYGQDATVSYGHKDFKFRNNTNSPIMIWSQGVDNILYVAFYGVEKPPEIEWHHEVLKKHAARKVYKVNPALPRGSEKLLLEGMDGAVIKSWITIKSTDGYVTTKQLGMSYYDPMPYVFEKGL